MVRLAVVLVLCLSAWSFPAAAQTAAQCRPYQEQTVAMDLTVATQMAASAAAAVGNNETYTKWFGSYSDANAERVRAVLKQIHAKLVSQRLALVCTGKSDATCREAYAWVLPATGVIRLCPDYFHLPSMAGVEDGSNISFGTREGTLIHEISHAVADTGDDCLNWADCRTLAGRSPSTAINNANSYESFAEDLKLQSLRAEE